MLCALRRPFRLRPPLGLRLLFGLVRALRAFSGWCFVRFFGLVRALRGALLDAAAHPTHLVSHSSRYPLRWAERRELRGLSAARFRVGVTLYLQARVEE